MAIKLNVNDKVMEADVDPDTPLLWTLRDSLGILGPKYGCGVGACGACTVHIDGKPARSCVTPTSSVGAAKVTTIEAMAAHPIGKKVQAAWMELDVAQCGYCQPGQIMAATALIAEHKKSGKPITDDDLDQIRNVCRCGTYSRIREAIKAGAKDM